MRKVSKAMLDPKQVAKLKKFKAATYKKSLVGSFDSIANLKRVLLRDLTRQVRMLQPGKPVHAGRIDRAREIINKLPAPEQWKGAGIVFKGGQSSPQAVLVVAVEGEVDECRTYQSLSGSRPNAPNTTRQATRLVS